MGPSSSRRKLLCPNSFHLQSKSNLSGQGHLYSLSRLLLVTPCSIHPSSRLHIPRASHYKYPSTVLLLLSHILPLPQTSSLKMNVGYYGSTPNWRSFVSFDTARSDSHWQPCRLPPRLSPGSLELVDGGVWHVQGTLSSPHFSGSSARFWPINCG